MAKRGAIILQTNVSGGVGGGGGQRFEPAFCLGTLCSKLQKMVAFRFTFLLSKRPKLLADR